MKRIIVQGSARSDGNTSKISAMLKAQLECDTIDLNTKNISQYDYDGGHIDDDFLPTIREIVKYDMIIFLTPVYWYAMSGLMKTFFDRITDCLKIEKETGRKLKGKSMAVVSCGSDHTVTGGFFVPFQKSAEYLGMHYSGHIHTWIEDSTPSETVVNSIIKFAGTLR